ncbi:hypothetical protein [Nocardioides sp. GCM10027113]|uniref:hypothetical protein n=1 Tax=unclassified Nocardioides TaxID=2615069 RepID=UPI003618F425
MTPEPPEPSDRPVDVEAVPDEEGVSQADAAERVDLDPEEQDNATDPEGDGR